MEILWLVYLIVTGAAVGLASLAVLYKQQIKRNGKIPVKEKMRHIRKELMPIGTSRGWRLWTVSDGLRVWQQVATEKISLTPSQVYGSFTVIAASLQEVMDTLKDTSLVQEWIPGVRKACQVWQGNDHDLLSIVYVYGKLLRIWDRAVLNIREMAGVDTSVLFAREWHVTGDIRGWLHLAHFQKSDDILWTCCLVTSFPSGDTPSQCVVSMMACSLTAKPERVCRVTSERLAGLKDYFVCKNLKYLSSVKMENEAELGGHTISTNKIRSVEVNSSTNQMTPLTERLSKATDERGVEESWAVRFKRDQQEHIQANMSSQSSTEDCRYNDTIEQALNKLISVYEANEGTDFWVPVGNIRGVHILKRPAQPGERPWDCFKGTTTINVPVHYILAYAFSLDERREWDQMFNKGKVVETFDSLTKVLYTALKPQWMSTSRDLCTVVAVRAIDEGLYAVVGHSVEHQDCPEFKGFVRAEMLCGGMVIRELSSDPPSCAVTYIGQVDIKGNIPPAAVNYVTQTQPQNLAVFRTKLEAKYATDANAGTDEITTFQTNARNLWRDLLKCACVQQLRTQLSGADLTVDSSEVCETPASGLDFTRSGEHEGNFEEEKSKLVQDTQLQPDHSAANSNNGRYNQSIDDARDNLAKAFDAENGDDGWIFVGYFSTVKVMKKPFQTGERPWDCFKGTTTINVPVHYVLAYAFSLDERGEWDERFNEGKVIETIDPLTKVIRMRFKPTWMSTPRDLCAVGAVRVLDRSAGVYGVIFQSVEHAECPEMKGYVRAEMLLNGIVVKELSSDPLSCQVSLIQQLDVKGYLSTKIVNRVAQPQIQNIAVFRRKLESRYSEENKSPDEKTRPLQDKADSLWSQLRSTDQECACSPTQRDDVSRVGLLPVDTLSSGSDNAEDSDYEDAGGDLGMTDDIITLPLVNGHKVDYRTLGNQAVAALLDELDIASKVEIPITANKSRQIEGEWGFETLEKDVVIIRKDCFADKLYSVLGKGIIKTSPLNVWQAVTNDMARHVYDRTLKKLKVVKEIDEDTKIVHTLHQAAQCFVKQARDFVILTMRRKEPEKFIYAVVSVDCPECPVQKGVVRGKVLASGWVIEPVLQDGQLISRVSYLAQIHVGESMPPRLLINYVARRQPLCIAYLREFLEKL